MKFPWPAIIYRCFKRAFITSIGLAVLLFIHNIIGTWKHIRKVIFLTEFQKSKFISSSLKFSPLKICVKPNLVNFNNKERKEQNVSFYANTKYFLFAGRLTEEKGINVLLNAWKGSSSSLYIAGEGPLLNEVTSHASNNKNIIYVGCKLDLSELMANAQALIVPSIWYEIFPMVILEAFSVGTTVIASRIGSLITLVNNEIDGLLFTPGDSVDLKNAVNRISEDNKLRERLKRGVDETYLKKYSPEISYKKLIEIYENL
jgi:glycosyltransferase involved in cell wall biosynthesis